MRTLRGIRPGNAERLSLRVGSGHVSGFSLVEVIIAATVLAIVASGALSGLGYSAERQRRAEHEFHAVAVAAAIAERIQTATVIDPMTPSFSWFNDPFPPSTMPEADLNCFYPDGIAGCPAAPGEHGTAAELTAILTKGDVATGTWPFEVDAGGGLPTIIYENHRFTVTWNIVWDYPMTGMISGRVVVGWAPFGPGERIYRDFSRDLLF